MADPAALARLRHELRTPLNHIIGYSEMLLEDSEGGGRTVLAPHFRQVLDDAQRLLGLINRVFSPAAAEEVDQVPAELAAPLQRIVASVERLRQQAVQAGAAEALPDLERIAGAAERLLVLVEHGLADAHTDTAGTPAPVAAARVSGSGEILVVDDNADNRDLLARRLTRDGHRVRVAAGGREALAALRAAPADLVLLDVMMPEMDGFEVLRQLKADPVLGDVPVLMISAVDDVASVVRCIETGAEDYLTKPFDPVLLRARVDASLERQRLRAAAARHARELEEWNRTLEARVREQVAQLERLGRLKRFFSPQLAELIVTGGADDPLRTHRREITVVFLDLRGFTAFAETAEPEEVMAVLREYHAEMGRLVLDYEGTLERFTGDGMMVFFNDPVSLPNPAERAVRMAVAMRERVVELGAGWRKHGYDLALGIGIAQGYATIGAIGYEGRWDYGAIGTVTNLASRLCAEAAPSEILVTVRVATAVEGLAELHEVGPLALKGLLKPVAAARVVALRAGA